MQLSVNITIVYDVTGTSDTVMLTTPDATCTEQLWLLGSSPRNNVIGTPVILLGQTFAEGR